MRGPGNVLAHRETANEHCAVLQISLGLRKISTLGFVPTCVVDGECTNKISLLKLTPGARSPFWSMTQTRNGNETPK